MKSRQHDRNREEAPFVSVIVPVFDDRCGLSKLLVALDRQSYPPGRFEVLVIDNGSTESLDELRGRSEVAVWLTESTPGSYAARNAGVRAARGEILAFTDADCTPEPTWLEKGVASLLAMETPGVVGGRIDVPLSGLPEGTTVCELYDSLCSYSQVGTLRQFRYFATANLFTLRSVLDSVGDFNPRFLSGGDREWCNRALGAGYELVYADDTVVRHPARSSVRALIRKSLRVAPWTMASGPETRYSAALVARQLVSRPLYLWKSSKSIGAEVGIGKRVALVALYYWIKLLQVGERFRVRCGGTPRR